MNTAKIALVLWMFLGGLAGNAFGQNRLVVSLGNIIKRPNASPTNQPSFFLPMPVLKGDLATEIKDMTNAPVKDRVVWEYRIAAQQLRLGNFDVAKSLLDDALRIVASNMGHSPNAAAARVFSESSKAFIGEPYERVMANYYRAICYWRDGDIESARASLKQAQFEDSSQIGDKYTADYVILDYLYGLASLKLNDDIGERYYPLSLTHTNAMAQFVPPPAYDPQANVMLFLEYGRGPTKYSTGSHNSKLYFTGGATKIEKVQIICDGITNECFPFDNLTFQAITRGGRVMDHILKHKAQFKTAANEVGAAALLASVGAAGAGANPKVSESLLAAGVVLEIISALTRPEADTRCWDNLPQCLSFFSFRAPPGQHEIVISFFPAPDSPEAVSPQRISFEVPPNLAGKGKDVVLFASEY